MYLIDSFNSLVNSQIYIFLKFVVLLLFFLNFFLDPALLVLGTATEDHEIFFEPLG